jgi:hypothetical protein
VWQGGEGQGKPSAASIDAAQSFLLRSCDACVVSRGADGCVARGHDGAVGSASAAECASISPSICPSARLSVCVSGRATLSQSIRLSVRLFVCRRPSVDSCVSPSVSMRRHLHLSAFGESSFPGALCLSCLLTIQICPSHPIPAGRYPVYLCVSSRPGRPLSSLSTYPPAASARPSCFPFVSLPGPLQGHGHRHHRRRRLFHERLLVCIHAGRLPLSMRSVRLHGWHSGCAVEGRPDRQTCSQGTQASHT